MSGNLSPFPIWQFMDQNGHPIANGTVTWYYAGTNHIAAIYADIELTVQLANPVHLDAAGRPRSPSGPTAVWLDSDRAYKQVHRDAQNRIIWTADNLVSPGTGLPGPPGPPGDTGPPGLTGPSGGPMGAAYLQGQWLPELTTQLGPGGGEFGQVYSFQEGWWTKIGRVVIVSGRIHLTQKGTWPSDTPLVMGGLPFTVKEQNGTAGGITFVQYSGLQHPWASLQGVGILEPNGFLMMGMPSEGGQLLNPFTQPLEENSLTDDSDFDFVGQYITDDDPVPPPGPNTGVWLPQFVGVEGQSGQSYAQQTGFYTRSGPIVFVYGHLQLAARGTLNASIGIGGIPFPVRATNHMMPDAGGITVSAWVNLPEDRPKVSITGVAITEPHCFWLRASMFGTPSQQSDPLYQEDLNNDTAMAFHGFYETDAE